MGPLKRGDRFRFRQDVLALWVDYPEWHSGRLRVPAEYAQSVYGPPDGYDNGRGMTGSLRKISYLQRFVVENSYEARGGWFVTATDVHGRIPVAFFQKQDSAEETGEDVGVDRFVEVEEE